jgi:hypothetical protein
VFGAASLAPHIDNGVRIEREDTKGREAIAQYIMRNVFNSKRFPSVSGNALLFKKVRYVEKTQKVQRVSLTQMRNARGDLPGTDEERKKPEKLRSIFCPGIKECSLNWPEFSFEYD